MSLGGLDVAPIAATARTVCCVGLVGITFVFLNGRSSLSRRFLSWSVAARRSSGRWFAYIRNWGWGGGEG
jgi:hypothetical protein